MNAKSLLAGLLAAGLSVSAANSEEASNPYATVRKCQDALNTPQRVWCGGDFYNEHDEIKIDRRGNIHLIPQHDQ